MTVLSHFYFWILVTLITSHVFQTKVITIVKLDAGEEFTVFAWWSSLLMGEYEVLRPSQESQRLVVLLERL